jgi:ABC-type nickel/cobalt efflux system permease component RcnA
VRFDRRAARELARLAALVAGLLLVAGALDVVLAQANPFGGPRPPATPALPVAGGGLFGWVLAKQAAFYHELSGLIRAAKTDGSAVKGLLAVSFIYGIFHAAGPGHGKAVISSYLIANRETWRRGVVLSFASAMVQALVAVGIVGIGAALLGATRSTMCTADWVIEIASYSLIIAVGARLLWIKGRGFLVTLRLLRHEPLPAPVGAAVTDRHERHDHHHHDHGHHHHDHGHAHHHDEACDHDHGPDPSSLAGPGGWRRGLSAIFAVGLRPCSGAILVLVFALAQGLFWAGAAATFVMGIGTAITVAAIATIAVGARGLAEKMASSRPGYGTLAMRGIEVGAAALIIAFGALLLAGYLATERLVGLC